MALLLPAAAETKTDYNRFLEVTDSGCGSPAKGNKSSASALNCSALSCD